VRKGEEHLLEEEERHSGVVERGGQRAPRLGGEVRGEGMVGVQILLVW